MSRGEDVAVTPPDPLSPEAAATDAALVAVTAPDPPTTAESVVSRAPTADTVPDPDTCPAADARGCSVDPEEAHTGRTRRLPRSGGELAQTKAGHFVRLWGADWPLLVKLEGKAYERHLHPLVDPG